MLVQINDTTCPIYWLEFNSYCSWKNCAPCRNKLMNSYLVNEQLLPDLTFEPGISIYAVLTSLFQTPEMRAQDNSVYVLTFTT